MLNLGRAISVFRGREARLMEMGCKRPKTKLYAFFQRCYLSGEGGIVLLAPEPLENAILML